VVIVLDAPTLPHWAAKQDKEVVQVLGRLGKDGRALAEGSALRKPINEAPLSMDDDATYENSARSGFPKEDRHCRD
jgi:polar amino acid transport system substrate-binding protein